MRMNDFSYGLLLTPFLLIQVHCQNKPTMNLDKSTKQPGTDGGLVSGLGTFTIEGTVVRTLGTETDWPNNLFKVQIRSPTGGNFWTNFPGCDVDFGNCATAQSTNCYCKARMETVSEETFAITITIVAQTEFSERDIRLSWTKGDQLSLEEGNHVRLPVMCDQPSETYNVTGVHEPLIEDTNVTKTDAMNYLEYCVTGLKGSYTVSIETPGGTTESRTSECATVSVTDSDVDKDFTLSYTEPSSGGCGRSDSHNFMFIKMSGPESTGSNDPSGPGTGMIIFICIAIFVIISVLVGTIKCFFKKKKQSQKVPQQEETEFRSAQSDSKPDPESKSASDVTAASKAESYSAISNTSTEIW